jgi:hypothetical protein
MNGKKTTAASIETMITILNGYMNEMVEEAKDSKEDIQFRHEQIGNYLINFAVMGIPLHKRDVGKYVEYYVDYTDLYGIVIPAYCYDKLKALNDVNKKLDRARSTEFRAKYHEQIDSLKQLLESYGEPVSYNSISNEFRFVNEYYFTNFL